MYSLFPLLTVFVGPLQLGIPHSFMMMSYQYKFQDDEQTKVKGSIKYVHFMIRF